LPSSGSWAAAHARVGEWPDIRSVRIHDENLIERDVVPLLRRYGLGLTVWSPLASGFLSGKYDRTSLSNPENRYSGFDIFPFDKEHGFKVVDQMRPIAKRYNATVAQVAIAWLLAKDVVSSVLTGATKSHQLEDNLGAVNFTLTDDEVAKLDAATPLPPVYPNWFIENLWDKPSTEALGNSSQSSQHERAQKQ
jgi:aryl-alcohol dehydrogenase-like predicted oxidoreductase